MENETRETRLSIAEGKFLVQPFRSGSISVVKPFEKTIKGIGSILRLISVLHAWINNNSFTSSR
jgi:hypothetical protein